MRSQPGELPQGLGWACRDSWRRDGAASRKLHGRFWTPQMQHSRPFLQGRCPLGCSSNCGERWDRAGLISLPLVCSGAPQKLGGEWLGPQSTGWGPLDAGRGRGHSPQGPRCPSPRVTGSADVDAVEVVGAEGRVALGALPLAGLVAAAHTLEAEHVEALGEHGILLAGVTAGAGQPRLGQAKASAGAQSCLCPDPKLTAGGRAKPPHGGKHLILAITLGEDEPPPRGSRDSEAAREAPQRMWILTAPRWAMVPCPSQGQGPTGSA